MSATVRDAMSEDCTVISEDESVLEAVKRMVREGTGPMPVISKDRRFLGMLRAHDVAVFVSEELDLRTTRAGEVAKGGLGIDQNEPLERAEALFTERGTPVLPVLADDLLVGLITRLDVAAYRRAEAELGKRLVDLDVEISPRDEMYQGLRGSYLLAGVSALRCITTALETVGRQDVKSILDLPCGHGRVLRILKLAFPQAQLSACDMNRDGVDFCRQRFGATPYYSDEDPGALQIDQHFDLIWCGSLLTHLDAPRWPGFLELFERCLEPGGLLVLTTHGRHDGSALREMLHDESLVDSMVRQFEERGFAYVDYTPGSNWGLSMSSPEWVRERIDEQAGLRLVHYADRAWQPPFPRQDVVACVRID